MLAEIPEDLQIEALKAIKEESDRLDRGDYTEEEKKFNAIMSSMGKAASETIDNMIMKAITA